MPELRRRAIALLLAVAGACSPSPPAAPAHTPSTARAAPAQSSPPSVAPPPAPGVLQPAADGTACGALGCLRFANAEAAFELVLAQNPRVLGIGESHAQRGGAQVPSTTRRFAEILLPLLQHRASDLVLELWVARGNCGKAEQRVAERQQTVTESHAATNQSEFVALGQRARQLGITPHVLEPSCAEYQSILSAGANDVGRMLQMIGERTARDLSQLLERQKSEGVDRLLVAYGGAIHNDVTPREGREAWSFGPAMAAATGGRYVELDLIVPEFIKDNEVWRALPWYAHYDKTAHPGQVVLFNPSPSSYVLIFAAAG
jgi:hypothetical protein